jgi:hypothetical protein
MLFPSSICSEKENPAPVALSMPLRIACRLSSLCGRSGIPDALVARFADPPVTPAPCRLTGTAIARQREALASGRTNPLPGKTAAANHLSV